jgi:hypothetical protein
MPAWSATIEVPPSIRNEPLASRVVIDVVTQILEPSGSVSLLRLTELDAGALAVTVNETA